MFIDLNSPLTISNAFRFPLQNRQAVRDLVLGSLILFIPVLGFMLNMGYRLHLVHNLQQSKEPWPGWKQPGQLLQHGAIASIAITAYHIPAFLFLSAWWLLDTNWLLLPSIMLWLIATFSLPGFMTFYCVSFDAREVWNPVRALSRAYQGGRPYLNAWAIGICGVLVSFLGLLIAGIGVALTSVWFRQAAAFCFARVFTEQYKLNKSSK